MERDCAPGGDRDRPGLPPRARSVLDALRGRERPATALDLRDLLRVRGDRTGLTTIYRAVHALTDAGLLHAFRVNTETAYRACSPGPHDHLLCVRCGRVQEHTVLEAGALAGVTAMRGFLVSGRRVELYGTCQRCVEPPSPSTSPSMTPQVVRTGPVDRDGQLPPRRLYRY